MNVNERSYIVPKRCRLPRRYEIEDDCPWQIKARRLAAWLALCAAFWAGVWWWAR